MQGRQNRGQPIKQADAKGNSVSPQGDMIPLTNPKGSAQDNKRVWLPRGFSFLSGLPEAARKRRVIVPIQGAFDDSGNEGTTEHFVLAGALCEAEAWAEFSDRWAAALAEPPAIPVLKTAKIAKWDPEKRDPKLRKLAQIINQYEPTVIVTKVNLAEHAEIWGKLTTPAKDVYFLPFFSIILGTVIELWERGQREKCELIFDRHLIFEPRVKTWYPVIRDIFQKLGHPAISLMPHEPIFRDDEDFLPLQAGDLLAYCMRLGDEPTMPLQWLAGEMQKVKLSKQSVLWNKERMQQAIATGMITTAQKQSLFPADVIEAYRKQVKREQG